MSNPFLQTFRRGDIFKGITCSVNSNRRKWHLKLRPLIKSHYLSIIQREDNMSRMGWVCLHQCKRMGALGESKSSREGSWMWALGPYYRGVILHSRPLKCNKSIIMECMGRMGLIEISFKSRGKQIEWIPQGPTLCSATWMWRVAPTSSSSSSSFLSLSLPQRHSFPLSRLSYAVPPPPQYLQVPSVDRLVFNPTFTSGLQDLLSGVYRGVERGGGKLCLSQPVEFSQL